MTAGTWSTVSAGLLIGASLFGAACGPRFDRTQATNAVYGEVLRAINDERIQVHNVPTGLAVAISGQTGGVYELDPKSRFTGPLAQKLRDFSSGAFDDLVRVKDVRAPVTGPFELGVPYEIVSVSGPEDAYRLLERAPAGLVTFSPVGFDRNGTAAILYVSHFCGGQCGTGQFIALRRHDAQWEIVLVEMTVIA